MLLDTIKRLKNQIKDYETQNLAKTSPKLINFLIFIYIIYLKGRFSQKPNLHMAFNHLTKDFISFKGPLSKILRIILIINNCYP